MHTKQIEFESFDRVLYGPEFDRAFPGILDQLESPVDVLIIDKYERIRKTNTGKETSINYYIRFNKDAYQYQCIVKKVNKKYIVTQLQRCTFF